MTSQVVWSSMLDMLQELELDIQYLSYCLKKQTLHCIRFVLSEIEKIHGHGEKEQETLHKKGSLSDTHGIFALILF